MAVIDRIKPDQRREQAPVSFSEFASTKVSIVRQVLFNAVQCFKKFNEGLCVSSLSGGKSTPVDTVIESSLN